MEGFGAKQLLACYARGVFPMADARDDPRIFLLDPDERGVIPLDRFHVPKRLAREVKKNPYEIRVDTAFAEVVRGCAEPGPGRSETWINGRILRLYTELHRHGDAHSVETWKDGELVGGLYGVRLGAAFFGESMFSRAPNASKIALVHLVARLRVGGFVLLDAQFITQHLRQFGAFEVSRARYHRMLADAIAKPGQFGALDSMDSAASSTIAAASSTAGSSTAAGANIDGSIALALSQPSTHTS